jgi:hypothetical protein
MTVILRPVSREQRLKTLIRPVVRPARPALRPA